MDLCTNLPLKFRVLVLTASGFPLSLNSNMYDYLILYDFWTESVGKESIKQKVYTGKLIGTSV